jgi:hypothetical protein
MTTKTQPTVAARRWTYHFTAPRRMGWPIVLIPGYVRPDWTMQVTKLAVTVRWQPGQDVAVESIAAQGKKVGGGKLRGWRPFAVTDAQRSSLGKLAPDWMHELAAEAVALAGQEVDRTERSDGN